VKTGRKVICVNTFIMVIDDSPTIRKIIEITLQQEGYSGISFADGISALKWLNEHPDMQPALVFLDVQMPGLDGHAWAHHIKSKPRFHNTIIVMMSGDAVKSAKTSLTGVTNYLAKPFTTQAILTTVRTYIPANALVEA
jgi:twitching motility two-component system response regulator PilG